MFGLKKDKEIKELDINKAYDNYLKRPQSIVILCVDEVVKFDEIHMVGSECFPLRLIKEVEEYYPEKDLKYYVYALRKMTSEKACKKMMKSGYDVYDLGSISMFDGDMEGIMAPKKRRRRGK